MSKGINKEEALNKIYIVRAVSSGAGIFLPKSLIGIRVLLKEVPETRVRGKRYVMV